MYEHFTDRARKVMQLANQEAQRLNHEYIGTEHILLGLVMEGSGVGATVLRNLGIDLRKVRREVERLVRACPDAIKIGKLPQTPRAKKAVEYAIEEARGLNHNYVGSEHLLQGLLREAEGVGAQVLLNLGLSLTGVREEVVNLLGHNMQTDENREARRKRRAAKSKTPALDSFGRDLTELARQAKLDPVVGRASEIEEVLWVLCCRNRNRPLLVGEAGVGKVAVVEGVAQLVAAGDVPAELAGRRIVCLDMGALAILDDASQARERFLAVLNEARRAEAHIFFPHLAELFGHGPASAVGGLFRLALRYGRHLLMGAVTPDEYLRHVEPDPALREVFQPIRLRAPTREETLEILRGQRPHYESHHRVQITDEALAAAVTLAGRRQEGCLPGEALHIIDRAGALIRLRDRQRPPDLGALDAELEQLDQEKESAVAEQDFARAAGLRQQADALRKRREEIASEWNERSRGADGVVDEPLVREVVARVAGR